MPGSHLFVQEQELASRKSDMFCLLPQLLLIHFKVVSWKVPSDMVFLRAASPLADLKPVLHAKDDCLESARLPPLRFP